MTVCRLPSFFIRVMSSLSLRAEVKPDTDVDDWEAIATDEEKGESFH